MSTGNKISIILTLTFLFVALVVGVALAYQSYLAGDIYPPAYPSRVDSMNTWSVKKIMRLYGSLECSKLTLMLNKSDEHYTDWLESCKTITRYKEIAEDRERREAINKIYEKLRSSMTIQD